MGNVGWGVLTLDMNKVKFPLKLPIAMVGYNEDTVIPGKLIVESESLRVGPDLGISILWKFPRML